MKLRQKRIYITLGIIDSTDTPVGGSLGEQVVLLAWKIYDKK